MKVLPSVLKHFDGMIGPCAIRFISGPGVHLGTYTPRNLLVIRPGGIGDAVLLLPAISALHKTFPDSSIDILAEKRNSSILSLSPVIRRILHYDKPRELFSALRESYDVVIDTEQWHRLSAIIARIMGAKTSIGFGTNERKKLFTDPQPYSHDDYEVHSFFRLLNPIIKEDIQFDVELPFLEISLPLIEKARSTLASLSKRKIIVIFPGSSVNERKWGSARFHQAARLLSKKGYGIVVVGGKDDIPAGEEIVSGLPGVLNLCGKLSLQETAAVLQKTSLLITGDSGIMHIGYGLGIKVLALFGPGREKKWAPRGKHCRVINKHLPCSPCTTFGYTPKCRNNTACMNAITVEELVREALSLLDA